MHSIIYDRGRESELEYIGEYKNKEEFFKSESENMLSNIKEVLKNSNLEYIIEFLSGDWIEDYPWEEYKDKLILIGDLPSSRHLYLVNSHETSKEVLKDLSYEDDAMKFFKDLDITTY